MSVGESTLGEGEQGEGQAWHVPGKPGGRQLEEGGRAVEDRLCSRTSPTARGLGEVCAGRDGPYAAGHLTDPRGRGRGGGSLASPLGVSRAGIRGGQLGSCARGKSTSELFRVVSRPRSPVSFPPD